MTETTRLWCDGPFELISVEQAGVKVSYDTSLSTEIRSIRFQFEF